MPATHDLHEAIQRLIARSETDADERAAARRERMKVREERRERFVPLAAQWLETSIRPRLETLAAAFPNATVRTGAGRGSVSFEPTADYPARASARVDLVHDSETDRVEARFAVEILPSLHEFEKWNARTLPIDPSARPELEAFLDERILRFVQDYLVLRDPTSYYQKGQIVTDPVCGMTFLKAESAARETIEGRTVYFCSEACRARFQAEGRGA